MLSLKPWFPRIAFRSGMWYFERWKIVMLIEPPFEQGRLCLLLRFPGGVPIAIPSCTASEYTRCTSIVCLLLAGPVPTDRPILLARQPSRCRWIPNIRYHVPSGACPNHESLSLRANLLLEVDQHSTQLENRVLQCGDLLNGPAFEYLSRIVITGILRLEAAHVIHKLADQFLGLGIDLFGSGFWCGFFHSRGNVIDLKF